MEIELWWQFTWHTLFSVQIYETSIANKLIIWQSRTALSAKLHLCYLLGIFVSVSLLYHWDIAPQPVQWCYRIKHVKVAVQPHSPAPIPPMTEESATPTTPLTTLGVGGPCGAILGKYKQPNPSAFMLNSTNAGVTLEPCILASFGVVMDTRHFTLVNGTGQPVDFSFFSTSNGVLFSSILACLDRGQLVDSFSEWTRSSSAGRQFRGEPRRRKSLQDSTHFITNYMKKM